jgi:hypothetical protein
MAVSRINGTPIRGTPYTTSVDATPHHTTLHPSRRWAGFLHRTRAESYDQPELPLARLISPNRWSARSRRRRANKGGLGLTCPPSAAPFAALRCRTWVPGYLGTCGLMLSRLPGAISILIVGVSRPASRLFVTASSN